ncbi:MAG: sugar phosphate isomerase/epimerase family protein [Verrucomicrobiales bacterium]
MKLGYVSAILAELSLEHVFRFAQEEGFGCVELMSWPAGKAERKYAGVTHLDAVTMTRTRADEIRGLASEYQMGISALGYYPNPLDADQEAARVAQAHLKKVIKAAQILGLRTVNTFIGNDHRLPREDNFARFRKVWPPLIKLAEDSGVRIGIENCAMFFTQDEWPGGKNMAASPAMWRRLFEAIPSDFFGLNYDPSHLVWMHMDWLKPLKEFAAKLFHIHAKDVKIDRDALNDHGILATPLTFHQPRIPGFGEIDWGQFMATLTAVGYNGPVCIEVEDETFGRSLEGRKRALRVARNVLAPFFPQSR